MCGCKPGVYIGGQGDCRAGLRHRVGAGVDKIPGGQRYVASAKRRVFGIVASNMIAGQRDPGAGRRQHATDWWRWTCFASEHDELAQSILLCPDAAYIDKVQAEIDRCCRDARAEIIAKSLNGRGA